MHDEAATPKTTTTPRTSGEKMTKAKRPTRGCKKAPSVKTSKTSKATNNNNNNTTTATTKSGSMKMTMYTTPTMVPRQQTKERQRLGRPTGKRLATPRSYTGKARAMARRSLDPCDNSNDSGLGFDHHVDRHNSMLSMADAERVQAKRAKVDVKLEHDEINDNYSFPEHTHTYRDTTALIRSAPSSVSFSSFSAPSTQTANSGRVVPRGMALINRVPYSAPITLTSQLQATSRYRDISLSIVYQPEQQHRARYQTEGSRGAVKDRSGNGFPVVQLLGYNKPTTLQVFIGCDQGKVSPHMFYQACKVSGKNSTPCSEKKIDGTIVIELQLEPGKDMQGTCDCVGILKERNVDVEHRFPDQLGSRAKKKSTRCRMVFRTTITHTDGTQETLQVCSQPIVCTQPPGVPEISKKSLTSCPASGGLELFIIGKNFLKDTVVHFQMEDDMRGRWEQSVVPDKEFLQQTHLICVVPPYLHPDIVEPVSVRMYVVSSGKTSEAHSFVYTPVNGAMPSARIESSSSSMHASHQQQVSFLSKMMPPPDSSMVPLSSQRRLSAASMLADGASLSPPMRCSLKQEYIDENSQSSLMDASDLPPAARFRHISESSLDVQQGDSNLSMLNENSMDMLQHHQQQQHQQQQQIMLANMNDNSNISMVNENSMEGSSHYSPQRSPEMQVIDLRRKMPMATVADLVNTKEPSMATLQSFGMMEHNLGPLPAQSAQSIENYLTNIENKTQFVGQQQQNTVLTSSAFMAPQMMSSAVTTGVKLEPSAVVQTVLTCTAPTQQQQQQQNVVQNLESGLLTSVGNIPAGIPTEGLNILVNCAVESLVAPKEGSMLLTQDVMMPAMINTNLTSPTLAPPTLTTPTSNISPEVILNAQISPSLMCRAATQDALLPSTNLQPICPPPASEQQTLTNPMLTQALVVNAPENAIILSAAADLLETQKNINEILTTSSADGLPLTANGGGGGGNTVAVQLSTFFTSADGAGANLVATITNSVANQQQSPTGGGLMMPVTVSIPMQAAVSVAVPVAGGDTLMKEMQQSVKKREDELRMVPPSLATMSENDLINIINPSCFDQGNNAMH